MSSEPLDDLFASLGADEPPVDEPEFAEQLQALRYEYPTISEESLRQELFMLRDTGMSFTEAADQIRNRFAKDTVPVGIPEPQGDDSPPTTQHTGGEVPVTDISDLFANNSPTQQMGVSVKPPVEEKVEETTLPAQEPLPQAPKPEASAEPAAPTPTTTSLEDMFSTTPPPPAVETPTTPPAPAVEDSIFGSQTGVEEEMKPILPTMPREFSISPVEPKKSLVIMFYSNKGDGKTTLALSLPGKIEALSFDNMTKDIHDTMYNNDPRITVWDALQEYDLSSEEAWLKSSVISLRYIDALLDEIEKRKPDWILIDGVDKFIKMAEMAMRYNNNFSIIDGVSWQYWKYRRLYIRQLHMKALRIASHGLLYTAYVRTEEKKQGDRVTDTEEHPKWVDVIEEESKVVIRVKTRQFEDVRRFYAIVDSSKWAPIRTGVTVDITVPFGETPDCFQRILEVSKAK